MIFGFGSKARQEREEKEFERQLAEAAELDAAYHRANMPEKPQLSPPKDGASMSVAFAIGTNHNVWIWIELTQTARQALQNVLDEEVDHYEADYERASASYHEHVDKFEGTRIALSAYEKEKFKREMFAPTPIKLREMLANPYRHNCTTPKEATDYIERCKKTILPNIKAMIDAQSKPPTDSFEL